MQNPEIITIFVFTFVGVIFVFLALGFAGRILRGTSLPNSQKNTTYECGELPFGNAWIRYNPRFFLLAIVFIIFDIEIAFLFPWGIVMKEAGIIAFWDIIIFLAIILAGYFWFWKIGELKWILTERYKINDKCGMRNDE